MQQITANSFRDWSRGRGWRGLTTTAGSGTRDFELLKRHTRGNASFNTHKTQRHLGEMKWIECVWRTLPASSSRSNEQAPPPLSVILSGSRAKFLLLHARRRPTAAAATPQRQIRSPLLLRNVQISRHLPPATKCRN
jgi:hypothetical protein